MEEKVVRKFKGIWIPKDIWLDTRLSPLEKVILLEIDSLDGDDGCFASNSYLAKFCQCSDRKVSETVTKLIKLGYVEKKLINGNERILYSKVEESSTPPRRKFYPPLEESSTPSNQYNNNIYNSNNSIDVVVNINIIETAEKEFGILTPIQIEMLYDFENQYGGDILLLAIKECSLHNVKNFAYLQKILRSWYGKSYEEIKKAIESYNSKTTKIVPHWIYEYENLKSNTATLSDEELKEFEELFSKKE